MMIKVAAAEIFQKKNLYNFLIYLLISASTDVNQASFHEGCEATFISKRHLANFVSRISQVV